MIPQRLLSQSPRKVKWKKLTRSCQCLQFRRKASTYSGNRELSEDVDPVSSLESAGPSDSQIQSYDPVTRAKERKTRLPRSRYQFSPPKYARGPLHPRQPLKPADPCSREFIPGPFSLPRLEQTYHSTIAPDLLTLLYKHYPPGQLPGPQGQRLRSWDDSSPYHKNRPLRAPRGGPTLPLMDRPITFRNVPRLDKIIVHSFQRESANNNDAVAVASMVLQTITNMRATVYKARISSSSVGLVAGKPCAVGMTLKGEFMYDFFAKMVEIVMPRIKEWRGVSAKGGDGNGNLQWGFSGDVVGLFPEVEINYDSYPPKMIPGIDISICTTATNDADARLLLASMGVPFYGKHVN